VSVFRVVVMDRDVLINLIHASMFPLLGKLAGYEFVVLDEVIAEIGRSTQAAALGQALDSRYLRGEALSDFSALALYAELSRTMGKGEAASLAAAATFGWSMACDEKFVFLHKARQRLGAGRILTTPGIIVLAIRAGLLTLEEADAIKALLEKKGFEMGFSSFQKIVG
jgi:predicted nucleic acid-binding protein